MQDKYQSDVVTYEDFEFKRKYGNHRSKEAKPLDDMHLNAIPETFDLRKKDGDAFTEKAELVVLVEWRA